MVVLLEMAAQPGDAFGQHGHLHLRGAGVCAVRLMGIDQLLLVGGVERHARGTDP